MIVKKEQLEQFKQKAHVLCEVISAYTNETQLRGNKALNLLSRILGYPSYSYLLLKSKGFHLKANEPIAFDVVNTSNEADVIKALHFEIGCELNLVQCEEIIKLFKIKCSLSNVSKLYQSELIVFDWMSSGVCDLKLSEEQVLSMKGGLDNKIENALCGAGIDVKKISEYSYL